MNGVYVFPKTDVVVSCSCLLPFEVNMTVYFHFRAAIILDEEDLPRVVDILANVSSDRIAEMRQQVRFFWERYMSSIGAITLTSLQIINDRVFPYAAQKYEDWNEPRRVSISNVIFPIYSYFILNSYQYVFLYSYIF